MALDKACILLQNVAKLQNILYVLQIVFTNVAN